MPKMKKRAKPESRTDYAVRIKGTRKWITYMLAPGPFPSASIHKSRSGATRAERSTQMHDPSLRGKLEIVPLRTRPLSVTARASRTRTR